MPLALAPTVYAFILGTIIPIVIQVVTALGIGFITYTGVDLGIDAVSTYIQSQMSGLPGYMLQLIGLLEMDTAIAMVLAAYAARFAIQATAGALSKVKFGSPGNSVGT